jgi:hypothetical protein
MVSQAPQLARSVSVSMQRPEQSVRPCWHICVNLASSLSAARIAALPAGS